MCGQGQCLPHLIQIWYCSLTILHSRFTHKETRGCMSANTLWQEHFAICYTSQWVWLNVCWMLCQCECKYIIGGMSLPCGRIERFNFETRTQSIFCDLLEELSGYLIMATVWFELSGIVEDSGFLGCDAVLLVEWFLYVSKDISRALHSFKTSGTAHSAMQWTPQKTWILKGNTAKLQNPPMDCIPSQHVSLDILMFTNAYQRNLISRCGMGSSGTGYGQVAGFCYYGIEPLGSIKCREFLD
jgi:hypothetical protein